MILLLKDKEWYPYHKIEKINNTSLNKYIKNNEINETIIVDYATKDIYLWNDVNIVDNYIYNQHSFNIYYFIFFHA